MRSQPIEVLYKELGIFPIGGTVQAETTGTAPIVGHTIEGTASAVPLPLSIGPDIAPHCCVLGNIENPKGVSGPTCIKFPILVRIWNYIVGFVHVVGIIEGARQPQTVTFESQQTSENRDVTALTFSYATSEDGSSPVFIMATIQQIKMAPYIIFTLLTHLFKIGYLHTNVRRVVRGTSHIKVFTYAKQLYASSHLQMHTRKFLHSFTALRTAATSSHIQFKAAGKISAISKLVIHKNFLRAATGVQFLRHRASQICRIALPNTCKLAYSKINTTRKTITHFAATAFRALPMHLSYFCIAKIQVGRVVLDKVLAYLETNVFWLKSKTQKHVITHAAPTIRKQVKTLILTGTRIQKTYILKAWAGIQAQLSGLLRACVLTPIRKVKNLFSLIQQQVYDRRILINPIPVQRQIVALRLNPAPLVRSIVYLDIDILDTLGKLDIIVRPRYTPIAYIAQLLVSTYASTLNSYALFDIQAFKSQKTLTPRIAATVTKLYLQWFLHKNTVSNEGYSNEILFTLGSITPVGPLPPAPQEEWTGGYVAAPFQGSGVKNVEAAAGYYSPKVDQWVKNASMLWGNPPAVFDDEGV